MQGFVRPKEKGRNAAVIGDDPEGIAVRWAKPDTMAELKVSRTLVKSRPELWAECSDAGSLARHLGAFGEIQITRLEPETAVAWEGDDVCGTVTLEPSGWGTRVVLTARADGETVRASSPAPESVTEAPTPTVGVAGPAAGGGLTPQEPGSAAESEPATGPRRPGFVRRLFSGWRGAPDVAVACEPASGVHAAVEPDPTGRGPVDPAPVAAKQPGADDAGLDPHRADVLVSALDSLGMAHRRPFTHG